MEAPPRKVAKLSKRINNRLQLAAALVEADNDIILLHVEQLAETVPKRHDPNDPRPAPPPEPKLASQSAIFAPYRDGNVPVITHGRTGSTASRLSNLSGTQQGRRSSIDFLGVQTPTEKKLASSSRAGSSLGYDRSQSRASAFDPGRTWDTADRPSSSMSVGAGISASGTPALDDEEVLGDWGIDKFLSQEERDRIATRRRSRADSLGDVQSALQVPERSTSAMGYLSAGLGTSSSVPGISQDGITRTRARSEIVENSANDNANLSLLAKIKLYRERQDNLPPDQWHMSGLSTSDLQPSDSSPKAVTSQPLSSPSVLDRPFPRLRPDPGTSEPPLLRRPDNHSAPFSRPNLSQRSSAMSIFDGSSADVSRASSAAAMAPMLDPSSKAPAPPITVLPNGHQATRSDATYQRRISTMGIMGTSWSDQEDNSEDDRPLSMYINGLSLLKQLEDKEANSSGNDNGAATSALPPVMVGVGSFLGAESRRNSLLGFWEPSTDAQSPAPMVSPKLWVSAPGSGTGTSSPVMVRSRPGTPGRISPAPLDSATVLSQGAFIVDDPYNDLPLGPSPFPQSPGQRKLDLHPIDHDLLEPSVNRRSLPMDGLTTRQLQALARNGGVPQYYGDLPASSAASVASDAASWVDLKKDRARKEEKERAKRLKETQKEIEKQIEKQEKDRERAREKQQRKEKISAKKVSTFSPQFKFPPLVDEVGDPIRDSPKTPVVEADLSSTRWMKKRRSASAAALTQALIDVQDWKDPEISETAGRRDLSGSTAMLVFPPLPIADRSGEVDDSDTSPPPKGPLRPRGLSAWAPKVLIMPQVLQGTPNEPRMRLTDPATGDLLEDQSKRASRLYVPDGFVLHDSRGLPPSKELKVLGARGRLPMFAPPKADKKHDAAISEFLLSMGAARTLTVPATAPIGIGRRAAAPTTVLFRNQLVTHETDQEGWGWENNSFHAKAESVSGDDDDDEPLEQLKKKGFLARTAARRARRAKRARKKARRERRAKRETAHLNGTDYAAVGVDEFSPDEDLDLSDTTSEDSSDGTQSEDSWNSDDEKRWVDDQKPVGKLFGMSLLDVAEERTQTRKSKRMFYGQQSLEQEAQVEASLGPVADNASVAPSVAGKTFREAPLGTNDTRERMELVFGTDHVWAREMAQRRQEEAEEAKEKELQELAEEQRRKEQDERRAHKTDKKSRLGAKRSTADDTPKADLVHLPRDGEDDGTPARPRTPIDPPTIDLQFGNDAAKVETPSLKLKRASRRNKDPSEEAAEWFTRSSDEEESSSDSGSEEEAQRRKEATRQARLLRSPGGISAATKELTVEQSDSSEDEMPLAQLRNRINPRTSTYAKGLTAVAGTSGSAADSSEEELPLAAIMAKRREASQSLGALNLDFMQGSSSSLPPQPLYSTDSTHQLSSQPSLRPAAQHSSSFATPLQSADPESDGDSDEDRPLGVAHPNGASALAAVKIDAGSDDEDDLPLGAAHPQAAIIAEQAALIKHLQEQQEQQHRMSLMGGMGWTGGATTMGGFGGMHAGMGGFEQPSMAPTGFEVWPPAPASVFNNEQGWVTAPLQQGLRPSTSMSMYVPPPPASVMGGGEAFASPFMSVGPGLSPSPSFPMMMGESVPSPALLAPSPSLQPGKVTSIDRWRNEVPPAPVGE